MNATKLQPKITDFFSNTKLKTNRNISPAAEMRRAFDKVQREDILEGNSNFAHIRYLPIYYGNVRSIPAKTDFRNNVAKSFYKVLCFTETWLNKEHYDGSYFPNGFNVYRLDRQTNAGGVAILVHDDFKSERRC